MNLREHIKGDYLHHAYLIEGERRVVLPELTAVLQEIGVTTEANADYHLYEYDAFLIADAHHLRVEQTMHAALGARKVFIVAFNTMLSEAQNALLKTLEEPTEGTHFFFVTRTGEILFPTVRSRMQIIKNQSIKIKNEKSGNGGEVFLSASLAERLKIIEKYTKVKADDKSKAKEDARNFLESLECALATKNTPPVPDISTALADILTAKRYLSDRSPSVKLLLEHLALTVPVGR